MLESFTEKRGDRSGRVTRLLMGSLCVHAAVLLAVLFVDGLRVSAVPQPKASVTYVNFVSLPKPPSPPAPTGVKPTPTSASQFKPEPRIQRTIAPRLIPPDKPIELPVQNVGQPNGTTTELAYGGENGVPGGIEGGVDVGVQVALPPAPSPTPAPGVPAFQPMEVVKKRRVLGAEPEYPRIARAAGLEATLQVKIFITPEGEVGEITFEKTDPHFEPAVLAALRSWRFTPHLIAGRPVGTYTIYRFVFRLD